MLDKITKFSTYCISNNIKLRENIDIDGTPVSDNADCSLGFWVFTSNILNKKEFIQSANKAGLNVIIHPYEDCYFVGMLKVFNSTKLCDFIIRNKLYFLNIWKGDDYSEAIHGICIFGKFGSMISSIETLPNDLEAPSTAYTDVEGKLDEIYKIGEKKYQGNWYTFINSTSKGYGYLYSHKWVDQCNDILEVHNKLCNSDYNLNLIDHDRSDDILFTIWKHNSHRLGINWGY